MKRSGKFYRKNEAEVMESLGLKPTINSGSGWIEKEDGISDNLICQLKSTDANSIRISKKDIDTLIYHAEVSHKLPIFAIQFLQSNEVYIMMKPEDIIDVAKYIRTGEYKPEKNIGIDVIEYMEDLNVKQQKKIIKSCSKAREQFAKENEKKFRKEKRSAK